MICQSYDTPRGRGLACYPAKDLMVDTGRASATGVFAASTKDRGGDVLEIAGIKTENHKKNPIVLWLHGFDYRDQDCQKPIGKCEDANGNYTVMLKPDEGIALATTFFNQSTQLSEQICALVMGKDVRAQSIGYREIKVERIYEDDVYIGSHLIEVEMIENSWVPVPMNPDAVRGIMARDVCGRALHPAIKAALSPYANPAPPWANGFTLEKKMPDEKPPEQPKPAAPKVKADEPEPKEKPDEEPEAAEKHGSKALRKCYKSLRSSAKAFRKSAEPLDDDSDTGEMIHGCADMLDSQADDVKAHHAKKYKDEEPLADDDDQASADDDPTASKSAMSAEDKAEFAKLLRFEAQLKHQRRLRGAG